MSFSSEVKDELSGHLVNARHCRTAELGAMVVSMGEWHKKKDQLTLILRTENEKCLRKAEKLLRILFSLSDLDYQTRFQNGVYRLTVKDENLFGQIRQSLKLSMVEGESAVFLTQEDASRIDSLGGFVVDNILIERSCCKRAFLRGFFLASGSVNNPEKGYHFEIVTGQKKTAEQLVHILESFEIHAKSTLRKGHRVVYLKEAQSVVDVLNVMEAPIALMKMENIRIVKDIRNSINRQINCEAANMHKTASAAVKQIEDIRYIEQTKGLSYLKPALRELAILRMEEPELSLAELGQRLDPPVGKSGVNHRLRKISEIAEMLRTS